MRKKIIEDYTGKLFEVMEDYVKKPSSILKGNFTRLVNKMAILFGVAETRKAAMCLVELLGLQYPHNENLVFFQRLKPGAAYYEESITGGSMTAMGWYKEEQAQAERIPLNIKGEGFGLEVWFYGFNKKREYWHNAGFCEAEELPYKYWEFEKLLKVEKDLEEYGFLRAEEMPYTYDERYNEKRVLFVKRNIKYLGFWNAYRYWDNCTEYYREKHPDWFIPDNWHWGLDAAKDIGSDDRYFMSTYSDC